MFLCKENERGGWGWGVSVDSFIRAECSLQAPPDLGRMPYFPRPGPACEDRPQSSQQEPPGSGKPLVPDPTGQTQLTAGPESIELGKPRQLGAIEGSGVEEESVRDCSSSDEGSTV